MANENANFVDIIGEEVDFIKPIAGELAYDENSNMKGKTYRRFAYKGKVFIAPTEDRFCKLMDAEKVWKVRLNLVPDSTDNTKMYYHLDTCVSIDRAINTANTQRKLDAISSASFKMPEGVENYEELG